MTMKFGVFAPQGWRMDLVGIDDPIAQYEAMSAVAKEAEKDGYDSVWLYDHVHTVPTPTQEPTFECWVSTAALARDTTNIRIGQLVTCNNYRSPALLAKMASSVDALSHGRLIFGLGAGWYQEEYEAYGYDYPDDPTRLKMLGEALQVIHALWQDKDFANFEGKYYRLKNAINRPKGVQKPHIPIMVGGGGEKVTLKLVAKYADACNFEGFDPELYRHKYEVLRGHCETVGRNYDDILRTAHVRVGLADNEAEAEEVSRNIRGDRSLADYRKAVGLIGKPQYVADALNKLVAVGVQYFIIYLMHAADIAPVQRFAQEVMPLVGE
jgi:F420-dependent oxidoreductase-like protein